MQRISLAALTLVIGLAGPALGLQAVFVPATTSAISISRSPIGVTQVITGIAGLRTYATAFDLLPSAATPVQYFQASNTAARATSPR
jgi:hypothetical protein